jgi:4-hydroxybenzoate polyprenyltransferase
MSILCFVNNISEMNATLRAYIDLLRLQFFFAWIILFSSGYLLATSIYGGFSLFDLVRVALIAFFGFEAGFVLNDYVDRDFDKKDIDPSRLTKYWRIFGTRPIPQGLIAPRAALALFCALALITTILIITLPFPHSLYVFVIMVYCYTVEVFYQTQKRHQHHPIAQLVGRTDFALFPVAGYLCIGFLDVTALLYFLFFYPFAMAHLGANDLIDIENDRARGMNTPATLYGLSGTAYWILGFTAVHAILAVVFALRLGWIARIGFLFGLFLLAVANILILKNRTPDTALKVLPLFHVTMLIYAGSIALDAVV